MFYIQVNSKVEKQGLYFFSNESYTYCHFYIKFLATNVKLVDYYIKEKQLLTDVSNINWSTKHSCQIYNILPLPVGSRLVAHVDGSYIA